MLNEQTGFDEARYYSMVMAVAVDASPRLRARALRRLVCAVAAEARKRPCRDTSLSAATRVRAWLALGGDLD